MIRSVLYGLLIVISLISCGREYGERRIVIQDDRSLGDRAANAESTCAEGGSSRLVSEMVEIAASRLVLTIYTEVRNRGHATPHTDVTSKPARVVDAERSRDDPDEKPVAEPFDEELHLWGWVNINQAPEAVLILLPGIGEGTAARICEYRSKREFRRPRDLKRVKGVGRKRYKRISKFIRVEGETTLRRLEP